MKTLTVSLLLSLTLTSRLCAGAEYSHLVEFYQDKLKNGSYNVNGRPLRNQDDILYIKASFVMISVIEINDVSQSFTFNGLLWLEWRDEILAWDPADYGNLTSFAPAIQDIWRPRVILTNSLGERDPFKDDFAPIEVSHDGSVKWVPGGLMTTTCTLDMSRYPTDGQKCPVQFLAMLHNLDQLRFFSDSSTPGGFNPSTFGEWDLIDQVTTVQNERRGNEEASSVVEFTFTLKRRPTSFMFTIMLPVIFISLLNILVFAIPASSGEKISYGITVLLAQAVFMTILQAMMPTSSDGVPTITIYIFGLLILSVLSVLISIVVVHYHHKEEEQESKPKKALGTKNIQHFTTKTDIDLPLRWVTQTRPENAKKFKAVRGSTESSEDLSMTNKWKLVSKTINSISFLVISLAWVAFTLFFLISIEITL